MPPSPRLPPTLKLWRDELAGQGFVPPLLKLPRTGETLPPPPRLWRAKESLKRYNGQILWGVDLCTVCMPQQVGAVTHKVILHFYIDIILYGANV